MSDGSGTASKGRGGLRGALRSGVRCLPACAVRFSSGVPIRGLSKGKTVTARPVHAGWAACAMMHAQSETATEANR